mgnify:CR=1 FL=1
MKLINKDYFRDNYIKEILDNFDFIRINKVMDYLNWKWASIGEVPNIEQLKKHAKKYLEQAYDEVLLNKFKNYETGSGGFLVEVIYDENLSKVIWLRLQFVLNEWYSECGVTEEELEKNTINE